MYRLTSIEEILDKFQFIYKNKFALRTSLHLARRSLFEEKLFGKLFFN
ncbi:hypothetical protein GXM_10474 [Nostoc sphaeroides CCNUC1]|uniref:Uncharacterized protein n=1 Tax=Nostoc sphaeroides CCNUC1 TaxID=2653204 RepID=A0A5P8WF93_9NOSO|nr:hypothetical protein GXM_08828 [Nostoc sphaeroides CCNUC1]QFS52719.1 hypothetical protein GXM_10474 [Nostoc sphaeroides CCNUC1]